MIVAKFIENSMKRNDRDERQIVFIRYKFFDKSVVDD